MGNWPSVTETLEAAGATYSVDEGQIDRRVLAETIGHPDPFQQIWYQLCMCDVLISHVPASRIIDYPLRRLKWMEEVTMPATRRKGLVVKFECTSHVPHAQALKLKWK